MYGLDSEHLRTGGQMLIKGEGELGAALSSSKFRPAGPAATLETLQADAKRFHAARGQSAVLNEAAAQL